MAKKRQHFEPKPLLTRTKFVLEILHNTADTGAIAEATLDELLQDVKSGISSGRFTMEHNKHVYSLYAVSRSCKLHGINPSFFGFPEEGK